MTNKTRVGVVFGGRSGEHEVSLASARSVMAAIDTNKYEVVPLGIAHSGQWLTSGDPMAFLTAQSSSITTAVPAARTSEAEFGVETSPGLGRELVPGATGKRFPLLEVVFPVLHGPYGEDGTIQGLLELAGVPYVGCGVLASALAMDKIASKQVFEAHGLPITPYWSLTRTAWETDQDAAISEVERAVHYPVFVKPANLGSSIGISKARDRSELRGALAEAARYDRRLLVEEAVPAAREIECSVLGNEEPIASVPGEVIPCNEFYDYAAKYIDGESQLVIPALLPADTTALVRTIAVQAFRAIDGSGLARVDFLLNGSTGELYLNEINTMPGFTKISMYPKLWEATGISYRELVGQLIELALERHADKNRSATSYAGAMKPGQ